MRTYTRRFGAGKRESHDSTPFYDRQLVEVAETYDDDIQDLELSLSIFQHSSEDMHELPDNSVALMVTSPPYHVGKDYDSDAPFSEYLEMLRRVFQEVFRVLQPGGRAVVNVANLGRRPYLPLAHIVTNIILEIGFLMRGEIIWVKSRGSSGNCAWGSWCSPANPVIRDVHEYCLCFSKKRFDRAVKGKGDITPEEFLTSTLSVWEIPPESARKVNHPAPFPVELVKRFIKLYTFPGELVLDPFLGSGSTAVAAVLTGRRAVGYETSAEYCKTSLARVQAAEELLERQNGRAPGT